MIKKKSLVAVFILLIGSVGLSACGKKDKKDNKSEESTAVTEAVTEDTQAPIDLTKSYKRGRVNGQNYKNEFFGFSCEFSDDWKLYNDEEIDEINQFQEGSMMVQTLDTVGFSERDYAESGLEMAAESLRQGGYTDVKAEIGTVKFCGRDRVSIDISAVAPPDATETDATKDDAEKEDGTESAGGRRIFEKQITAINGKYICVLTFKSDSEENVDKIISMFK